jgi:hypothetical protein
MKTARSYVFVFVLILLQQVANTRVATGFGAGSNGSSPPDQKHDDKHVGECGNGMDAKLSRCAMICSGPGSSIIPDLPVLDQC